MENREREWKSERVERLSMLRTYISGNVDFVLQRSAGEWATTWQVRLGYIVTEEDYIIYVR